MSRFVRCVLLAFVVLVSLGSDTCSVDQVQMQLPQPESAGTAYYRYGGKVFKIVTKKVGLRATITTWEKVPGTPNVWRRAGENELAEQISAKGENIGPGEASRGLTEEGRIGGAELRPALYVLDVYAVDRVVAIDPIEGEIVDQVELPLVSPTALGATVDGATLYITHLLRSSTTFTQPGTIVEIETNPLRVSRRIELPAGASPPETDRPLVVSPDGARLYVSVSLLDGFGLPVGGEILVYDRSSATLLSRVPHPQDGAQFSGLQISPDGTVLYALGGRSVVAIDTLTATVSAELIGGLTDNVLEIHPSGSALYVGKSFPRGVIAVDTATLTVVAETALEDTLGIEQIRITGDGRDLFVNDQTGAVFQLDARSLTIVDTQDNPDGDPVWIAVER